jgi:hypothetical protein
MESLVVILNRVIYVEPWKHFINVPLVDTPVSYLSILSTLNFVCYNISVRKHSQIEL